MTATPAIGPPARTHPIEVVGSGVGPVADDDALQRPVAEDVGLAGQRRRVVVDGEVLGPRTVVVVPGCDRAPGAELGDIVRAAGLGAGADRRSLPSTERLALDDRTGDRPVDVGVPDLDGVRPPSDLLGVERVDAAGETELARVLEDDRLVERRRARISPSTGPKHSVRWNHEPGFDPDPHAGAPQVPGRVEGSGLDEPRLARFEAVEGARARRSLGGPISGPTVVGLGIPGGTAPRGSRRRRRAGGGIGASRRVRRRGWPGLRPLHFCPAWPNADRTRSCTARSMSACGVMTRAFFPDVSAKSRIVDVPRPEQVCRLRRSGEDDGVANLDGPSPGRAVGRRRRTRRDRRGGRRRRARRGSIRPAAHRLGCRLEQHRVAGGQRGEHAARRGWRPGSSTAARPRPARTVSNVAIGRSSSTVRSP